jgi:signal transduction histidine kinase
MKIRLRLALWYFSITLFILLLFLLGTYLGMRQLLFTAIDKELDIVIESIENSYDPGSGLFPGLENNPINLSQQLKKFYLVVRDASGNPVFYSLLAQQIKLNIPLPRDKTEIDSFAHLEPEKIPSLRLNGRAKRKAYVSFRAISRKLFYEEMQIGWATIALPIADVEDSLEHLFILLAGGGVMVAFLLGVGSFFLTRQALSPIRTINRKARQISHSHLDERIDIYNRADELGQLSMVLNDLFERLQKAFESQKLFLADAAHELKTPLSILRSHWESEINNPEVPLELKEKIVQDVENITRLSHLINNLLLLSQTEQIESNFEFNSLKLDVLLQEVIIDAQMMADAKSQQLHLVELTPVTIQGDRNRLYQLFFNLIDNASKYTPEGGKIWISLRLENEQALAEVRDNGLGISPLDLPHIFKRFYRVQKDRARKSGGSGLGLSICKLIVEAHKGIIEAESELGKGSVFRVRLPYKASTQ